MGFRQQLDQAQTIAESAFRALHEKLESGVLFLPIQKELRADPHPYYRRLRERDPVHRSRLAGGWMLSREHSQYKRGCPITGPMTIPG